jgi:hypothetical protein
MAQGRWWLCALLAVPAGLIWGWNGGDPAAATTGSAKPPLVDWNCTSPGRVKPARIVLACGDGNAVAENLRWTKWGITASGRGDLRQNDCIPDCASGTFHVFPAWFGLSHTVSAAGRNYFTRIKVRFEGAGPSGHRTEVLTDCFVRPPEPYIPRCP